MSSFKSKLKRLVKSHIFRVVVSTSILFSSVFLPMILIYPNVASEYKGVVIVIVVFVCIFEVLMYALFMHFFVFAKITEASDALKEMTRDDTDYKKVSTESADNCITELMEAVNATADEYAKLEHVHKSFVSNASHELRSPLTSIQGFLQAVLDGTVTAEDADKYLKIALSETKRLNTLITSMLDLSRLDSGKNPIVCSKFDINDVVSEVAAKFEPALIKKALQMNVDFERKPCYVFADKDKIFQVIINLVDNAIKYSPTYSRIILTTSIHESKAYVTVRDFGYGISKKDQMLIWDRFFMTDKSRSPVKTKGTGLGLSIVKKIIDEHGEIIWVESNRGAGATFIFTLPLFDPAKHKINKGTVISSEQKPTGEDDAT